jgi:hypothetical protein
MKIKYEDKINIDSIKNPYKYEMVARVVDKPSVLNHIRSIRRNLGIETVMSYDEAIAWLNNKEENLKHIVRMGLWFSTLKVSPLGYFNAIKNIKTRIYSEGRYGK